MATARKTSTLEAIPSNDHVLKLELDVTSVSSIDVALHTTLEKFGRIDVVVNNAGYTLAGDTESAEDGESRALFDTNFWGMVDVSKKALGIFRDENPKTGQQGGVIANVSSMGGWSGYPGQSFYHASKFAMEGWTEAVAKEVPPSWNSKFAYSCIPQMSYSICVTCSMLRSRCDTTSMNAYPTHVHISSSPPHQYRARRGEDELRDFFAETDGQETPSLQRSQRSHQPIAWLYAERARP